jgi:hypothetical protein
MSDSLAGWRSGDLWYWSLEAVAANVRAAADRTGQSVAVCRRIAEHRGVSLAGDTSE